MYRAQIEPETESGTELPTTQASETTKAPVSVENTEEPGKSGNKTLTVIIIAAVVVAAVATAFIIIKKKH